MVNCEETTPLSKGTKTKIIEIVDKRLLKQIPNCPHGQCAQIAQSAGKLGLKDSSLVQWIVKNSSADLANYSIEEIYMLIHGAEKLFSKSALHSLIKHYETLLIKDPRELKQLEDLKPNGIACLLKACARTQKRGFLSVKLFEMAIKQLDKFSLQEKIDLIAGLYLFGGSDHQTVLKMLRQIEASVLMSQPSQKTIVAAFVHFSYCLFLPEMLLPQVKKILENSEVTPSIKNRLFYTFATLNLGDDPTIQKQFATFFNDQVFQLDDNALIDLLRTAAILLSEQSPPPLLRAIVDHLMQRHRGSSNSLKNLPFGLTALHYFEEAAQVAQLLPKETITISEGQQIVTKAVQEFFKKHPLLKKLNVISEGEIHGHSVDILITGFDALQIKQEPIAIEIDGPNHFLFNFPHKIAGKNILREKTLKGACELIIVDLREGCKAAEAKLSAYFLDRCQLWKKEFFSAKPQ